MTYSIDDMRDAEGMDYEYDDALRREYGTDDPDEIREEIARASAERPIVDASYYLKLPEGNLVEVVVLAVEDGRVMFRRVGSRGGPTFTYPCDTFMEMAL